MSLSVSTTEKEERYIGYVSSICHALSAFDEHAAALAVSTIATFSCVSRWAHDDKRASFKEERPRS